ncbi:MAG: leucine-rich repeat protein [Clostridia bacterium]|nr:leucine-rich repeat protein [Clostridia bacterium]
MKKNFRKALSIFLTLLIILSIAPTNIVTKANATDERITWTFDGETVTISGTGALTTEYTTTDEWKNMQDECVNVIVEGEIEAIGDNAFKGFTAIENVEVTSSLEKIGKYSFSDCTSLESITLPDTVTVIDQYAFSGCKALKDFQFPKSLIKINQWAFKGCECFDNKELVLPDTLQKVGYGAFSGANITSLTAPFVGIGIIKNEDSKNSNNIGHMFGNVSFSDTYVCRDGVYAEYYYMPNSLKEVNVTKRVYDNNFENAKKIEKIVIKESAEITCIPYAFAKNCQELKEIIIENSDKITKISDGALEGCYALGNFTIPQNVTEIGYRAFALCRFSSIEIPEKVEIIGAYAFFKCSVITSIVIPDSVKSIGEYAFKGCSNLENVKMPSTYYTIGEGVFDETKYTGTEDDFVITEDGVLTKYRGTDTEIVVPEGVTQIGTTFSGNTTVTSIILPNSLLYIEENAFSGCSALTKIVLPESLEYISANSFSGCSSLTEINLPDGLLTIPGNAFMGCSSLPVLTIPDTVLEIKPGAFYGCCKIKELIIPDSVVKIERRAFAGMCGLEKLTVPFIGQSRDVETNSYYAIIGYWFDSDQDDLHGNTCNYCRGYFNKVNQTYVSVNGYKWAHNIWEPSNFKELTVNGGTLRSYALKEFGLEILNIGENVEAIEEYAADNLGLKELNFHEDAKFTEIPYRAFSNNSITSITIPKNVKKNRRGIYYLWRLYKCIK